MSTTFHQPQKATTYAVKGLRLGTAIHTPFGRATNGEISDVKQIGYLRTVCGYQLEPCAGVPEFTGSIDRDDAMRNPTRCHAIA
jgi:hypothetical protein